MGDAGHPRLRERARRARAVLSVESRRRSTRRAVHIPVGEERGQVGAEAAGGPRTVSAHTASSGSLQGRLAMRGSTYADDQTARDQAEQAGADESDLIVTQPGAQHTCGRRREGGAELMRGEDPPEDDATVGATQDA